jgi:MFS family permease
LFNVNESLPFLAVSLIFILALAVIYSSIKESRDVRSTTIVEVPKINYTSELNSPTVLLLAAIFFWFISIQGMEALFTLYGVNKLGLTKSASAFSLAFFSLAFILSAIPSGVLGAKYGKKKMIVVGILGLIFVFICLSQIENVVYLRVILLAAGMFWASININAYPFIVSTGSEHSYGTRTGLYYLVSSLAAIISPPSLGLLIDIFGYSILFYAAAGSMLIALTFMIRVKSSENVPVLDKN